ncbi:16S rRNA (uracil(1498)-N(3))-methyltransferase [Acinetobacter larvae]|uniref:Ribosomal RNA small subunit methyltransferase E n=1 Tax=Acinetobacter larvae TaxID=1789224 RepID=A0A1B2M365_9GAMM|nr:16S rRNA (uracil(1498)-N(3))-methyltransferase [Acinetobacter larvae]AOA59640.1 16S rRNA (uracil(1498)-N(3))-methyltransferase [Acinetobacter larvae]
MNIVLIDPPPAEAELWYIQEARQLQHLQQHLKLQVGEQLKVGIRAGQRYLTEVVAIDAQGVALKPIMSQPCPGKIPLTLIVALPRPKVLRRLIMDSVSLGVEKIVLIHSYRVDKSYWQSPFLQQLPHYIDLGLEQAGDTIAPQIEIYQRFKPFVEDVLAAQIAAGQTAWVAHPYAEQAMPHAIDHPCSIVIGPEGGFIPYEIELLQQNGCQARCFGTRILRTETAISYVIGRLYQ